MGVVKQYIKITKGFAESSERRYNNSSLDYFQYGKTNAPTPEWFTDVNAPNSHPDLNWSTPYVYIDVDHDDIAYPQQR